MSVYGASARRDRHGWFLGLTGAQLTLLMTAAVPAWLAMAVGRWVALLVLVPGWIIVALLTTVPIRGWSAAQWIGVLTRHAIGSARGWTTWRAAAATLDPFAAEEEVDQADLPGILAGIRLHDGPPLTGRLERPALIQNLAARTWAMTARLDHPGIGMADDAARLLMGAGLAELLESCSAGGQIHHLAMQVRTVPDDGTQRDAWVHAHRQPGEPELSDQLHHLLDHTLQAAAVRTEAFLTIVCTEHTIGRDARRAGRGTLGRARVLHHVAGEVEARLLGALGCTQVTWLDTAELAAAIRTGFEPGDAAALGEATLASRHHQDLAADVPLAAAGPVTATTTLRCYRHGDWISAAATILLPRQGAVLGSLARVLVPSTIGERRALTVYYRPLGHAQADRQTGRAEMSAAMSSEILRRVGRIERASDRRTSQQLHDTDEKLHRGRALVHLTTAASVTVPADWDAHDHSRRLDASIRLSGFAPLPLDGAHDAGFAAATIPLGIGLPTRRGR
jgi:hypothetical protein